MAAILLFGDTNMAAVTSCEIQESHGRAEIRNFSSGVENYLFSRESLPSISLVFIE